MSKVTISPGYWLGHYPDRFWRVWLQRSLANQIIVKNPQRDVFIIRTKVESRPEEKRPITQLRKRFSQLDSCRLAGRSSHRFKFSSAPLVRSCQSGDDISSEHCGRGCLFGGWVPQFWLLCQASWFLILFLSSLISRLLSLTSSLWSV